VRLTADGKSSTRPLEIVKDTQLPASEQDLVASTKTQVRIRDDMNAAVDMINRIEVLRKQVEDLEKTKENAADVKAALAELDKKAMDVLLMLLSKTDLHSDDKWYVEAYKVYMNLVWLSGVVGTGAGDVAGGADNRPTDASLAVLETLEKELGETKTAFSRLMEQDVPAFNRTMTDKGL